MLKTGVLVMLLSTSLFANWFTNLFDPTPTPTIKIPVDLTKAGTIVDMEFRVDYDEATYFALRFSCTDVKLDDGLDCKEMRKFMGLNVYSGNKNINKVDYKSAKWSLGNLIDETYDFDGTRVPLRIRLSKVKDNRTLVAMLDSTYDTKGRGDGQERDITSIHLKKANYKLVVENLEAFSELKGRKIEFKIQSTYRK